MSNNTALAKNKFVTIFDKEDSIYNHCMSVKRKISQYIDSENYFVTIAGVNLPKEYWYSFYKMLWCKYLKNTTEEDLQDIPEDILKFKDFNTTIEGKIFSKLLKEKQVIPIVEESIFKNTEDYIICNIVNSNGDIEKGTNEIIFHKYPETFHEYKEFCECYEIDQSGLLGQQQLCNGDGVFVSNLFCKKNAGTKSFIDYSLLEKALFRLKEEAISLELNIAFPYGAGVSLIGGEWEKIYFILTKVFSDYPIVVFKNFE